MINVRETQRGFSVVAAIFLLVVLASLGAFMLTFSNTQHLTSAQDVQGSRAYWAARAGTSWAISTITATPTVCPVSPTTFHVDDFTVSVTCDLKSYDEGGVTKRVFSTISTSASGGTVGDIGRTERSLSATLEF
ncbi:MAG: hypothetical protein Q8M99_01680 [Methylotenera sp.]|nr:hypothetical protein [Methylotenera sp.]